MQSGLIEMLWDMRYELWDMNYGIWDMRYELWNMGYGIWVRNNSFRTQAPRLVRRSCPNSLEAHGNQGNDD
jgi:hypothetical protein